MLFFVAQPEAKAEGRANCSLTDCRHEEEQHFYEENNIRLITYVKQASLYSLAKIALRSCLAAARNNVFPSRTTL